MATVLAADSSLEYDRDVKVLLHARYGVAEVWLVNLQERVIEVYRDPSADGYRDVRGLGRGEPLQVQALLGLTLSVDEILG